MASVSAIIPTTGRIELRRAVVSVLKQTVYTRPVVVNDRPAARGQVHDLLKGLDYSYFETDGPVRKLESARDSIAQADLVPPFDPGRYTRSIGAR